MTVFIASVLVILAQTALQFTALELQPLNSPDLNLTIYKVWDVKQSMSTANQLASCLIYASKWASADIVDS